MSKLLIRVYGLFVNEHDEILLSDEYVLNTYMCKFPGGGLEHGEGLVDCLIRELKEECKGQKIKNIKHFYTTDFYQKALFYRNAQLISVYYMAEFDGPLQFEISDKPYDFTIENDFGQSFRWVKIKNLDVEDLSFPIDKFVAQKLKETTKHS